MFAFPRLLTCCCYLFQYKCHSRPLCCKCLTAEHAGTCFCSWGSRKAKTPKLHSRYAGLLLQSSLPAALQQIKPSRHEVRREIASAGEFQRQRKCSVILPLINIYKFVPKRNHTILQPVTWTLCCAPVGDDSVPTLMLHFLEVLPRNFSLRGWKAFCFALRQCRWHTFALEPGKIVEFCLHSRVCWGQPWRVKGVNLDVFTSARLLSRASEQIAAKEEFSLIELWLLVPQFGLQISVVSQSGLKSGKLIYAFSWDSLKPDMCADIVSEIGLRSQQSWAKLSGCKCHWQSNGPIQRSSKVLWSDVGVVIFSCQDNRPLPPIPHSQPSPHPFPWPGILPPLKIILVVDVSNFTCLWTCQKPCFIIGGIDGFPCRHLKFGHGPKLHTLDWFAATNDKHSQKQFSWWGLSDP